MELKINDLSKKYDNNKVLDNINITINESQIVFIVGKSGSGKSTLLNIIGGMEKESIGIISFYDGKEHKLNTDSNYISDDVGFIFQDFNLIMGLSIIDNIKVCLGYSKIKYTDFDLKEKINAIGLKNPYQIVDTLSGGERQRVAILRASLKKSKIILADEPTGNLDTYNSTYVFNELVELKKNRIIIVVTHDITSAFKYADRIITLSDGKIISDVINKKSTNNIDNEIECQYKNKKNYNILKLMINSMKKHKIRSFSFFFILVLCIILLSVSLNLYTDTIDINENLNVNYLETDLVSIMYDKDDYGMYLNVGDRPIEEELINNLANSMTSHYVKKYGESNYFLTYNNNSCMANIREVCVDNFFKDRYSNYNIMGDFLKNKYDIVIGLNQANSIFNNIDPIGKKIKINDGNGFSISLNVIGVNNTETASGEYLTLISNEVIKELVESQYKSDNICEITKFSRSDFVGINDSTISRGNLIKNDNSKNIILGNDIENKNDVLISSFIYKYISESDKDLLFKDRFYIKLASTQEIHIVGIYEDNLPYIVANEELILDLLIAKSNCLNIYLNDYSKIDKYKEYVKTVDNKLLISSNFENLKFNVLKSTKTTQDIMLVISIAFFLISIVMMYSYLKIIMIEKTYEIGILKSFGASNINIFINIISDILCIMICSIAISLLLTPLVNIFITSFIDGYQMIKLTYPIKHLILIGISLILLSLLCASLEMIKNRKKTISELLREKNI